MKVNIESMSDLECVVEVTGIEAPIGTLNNFSQRFTKNNDR